MYTETSTLSPTRTWLRMCQHRTVCSVQSHRTHLSFAPGPKLLCARLYAAALGRRPTLASPSARRRAKQMLALVAELQGECCRAPDPCFFCTTAATVGEPPDSRRGGAVTFNLSRCASCEGARESRGSHAAGLNEGWRWGACGEVCILGLGIFGEGVLTRCLAS